MALSLSWRSCCSAARGSCVLVATMSSWMTMLYFSAMLLLSEETRCEAMLIGKTSISAIHTFCLLLILLYLNDKMWLLCIHEGSCSSILPQILPKTLRTSHQMFVGYLSLSNHCSLLQLISVTSIFPLLFKLVLFFQMRHAVQCDSVVLEWLHLHMRLTDCCECISYRFQGLFKLLFNIQWQWAILSLINCFRYVSQVIYIPNMREKYHKHGTERWQGTFERLWPLGHQRNTVCRCSSKSSFVYL